MLPDNLKEHWFVWRFPTSSLIYFLQLRVPATALSRKFLHDLMIERHFKSFFFVICIRRIFTNKTEKFQLRGNNSLCAEALQLLCGRSPAQLRGNPGTFPGFVRLSNWSRATFRWKWVWRIGGKTERDKYSGEKFCPSATFFTTNVTWTGLVLNPYLRDHRPVTKRPDNGTACD
jgi:hypothetical protein